LNLPQFGDVYTPLEAAASLSTISGCGLINLCQSSRGVCLLAGAGNLFMKDVCRKRIVNIFRVSEMLSYIGPELYAN
jgi:hypothetical protein